MASAGHDKEEIYYELIVCYPSEVPQRRRGLCRKFSHSVQLQDYADQCFSAVGHVLALVFRLLKQRFDTRQVVKTLIDKLFEGHALDSPISLQL